MTGYLIPRLECDGDEIVGHDRSCVLHFSGDVNVETLPQLRREAFDQGWTHRRVTTIDGDGVSRSVMVDLCGPCSERYAEQKEATT